MKKFEFSMDLQFDARFDSKVVIIRNYMLLTKLPHYWLYLFQPIFHSHLKFITLPNLRPNFFEYFIIQVLIWCFLWWQLCFQNVSQTLINNATDKIVVDSDFRKTTYIFYTFLQKKFLMALIILLLLVCHFSNNCFYETRK